jgi:MFS family permease
MKPAATCRRKGADGHWTLPRQFLTPWRIMTETPQYDDRLARRNLIVLIASQAVIGAQLPAIFNVAGLTGKMLSPNPCWATLAVTAMVLGSMAAANPLSAFMARHGRKAGFIAAALFGAGGAAISAWGLLSGSFTLFVIGALFSGTYMSAQGFYRFAAADTASPEFRAKAISWVTAGGLISAVVGPELVKLTSEIMAPPFLGTYITVVGLNLLGILFFSFLKFPPPVARTRRAQTEGRSRWQLITTPRIAVAVTVATVSYALMNLVMTSAPLAVVGCGYHVSDSSNVITAHVIAMYLPSFFTGHVIARFGVEKVMTLGLGILALAGVVALTGVDLTHFFAALILLGVGWNFGFIGATTMLASAHEPSERGRMQGLNDFIVFGGVTLASFSSGGLMNCSGGTPQAGWQAVNMAMVPFLVLAGAVLIWFALRPREV